MSRQWLAGGGFHPDLKPVVTSTRERLKGRGWKPAKIEKLWIKLQRLLEEWRAQHLAPESKHKLTREVAGGDFNLLMRLYRESYVPLFTLFDRPAAINPLDMFAVFALGSVITGNTIAALKAYAWMANFEGSARRKWIGAVQPDIKLGRSRQKSQQDFGNRRGADLHDARTIKWMSWQKEADELKRENPSLACNKSELARKVKSRLHLPDAIRTIRHRIS